jgi:hypothetical protein
MGEGAITRAQEYFLPSKLLEKFRMREASLAPAHISASIVRRARARARVFENIQSAVDAVGDVDQTRFVHVNIVELNRRLAVGRGRYKKSRLFRSKWVADIDDADAGVEVAEINQQVVIFGAGTIFMDVVRARPPRRRSSSSTRCNRKPRRITKACLKNGARSSNRRMGTCQF